MLAISRAVSVATRSRRCRASGRRRRGTRRASAAAPRAACRRAGHRSSCPRSRRPRLPPPVLRPTRVDEQGRVDERRVHPQEELRVERRVAGSRREEPPSGRPASHSPSCAWRAREPRRGRPGSGFRRRPPRLRPSCPRAASTGPRGSWSARQRHRRDERVRDLEQQRPAAPEQQRQLAADAPDGVVGGEVPGLGPGLRRPRRDRASGRLRPRSTSGCSTGTPRRSSGSPG